ncbi:ABC transporter substrate-binding protein [Acetobacter cibinongensis]|uniref:ABC transporter substrate-binding protein n=1 Tax=Acetobacter cibinongensis TaxID=146475 RepID=UPI000A39A77A|nr:ABC transporter substrate-binding protein [Acetobacter cibinongensis]
MSTSCRIGLLQLADSAPVIVAHALNLFSKYGVAVEPVIVPSWANIADGLVWNGLDGSIMFAPLAIMTALGQRGRAIALRPGLPLSREGNKIVLRGQHAEQEQWHSECDKHRAFQHWAATLDRKPRLAVVHLYSTHYLILTRFLKSISICRDTETEIVIMPPANMIEALAAGEIDGFCAGPPWGADAALKHLAFPVAGSASIVPGHLEKMLILKETWKAENPDATHRIYNAVCDAAKICTAPEQTAYVTDLLSAPLTAHGLGLPVEAVATVMPAAPTAPDTMIFDTTPRSADSSFGWMIQDMQTEGWLTRPLPDALSTLGWV